MIKKNKPSTSPKVNDLTSSKSQLDFNFYTDSTLLSDKSQEQLSPTYTETSELKEKFTPKHSKSILLSDVYMRIGQDKKSLRVCNCGSYLEFAHEVDSYGTIDDKGKLHKAFFCRDRFCPMCSWRRSLKLFANVSQCLPKITSKYKCVLLTLTVPNCQEEDFRNTIDRLMTAWHKLAHYKKFKTIVKGYFRVLEITRNKKNGSLHPHFHIILVVPKSYGKKEELYLSHAELLEMWRSAYGDETITQVDIRLIKPKDAQEINSPEVVQVKSLESAIAETCKYTFKDEDLLFGCRTPAEQDNLLLTLIDGLHHRRLAHFGGVFKEIYNSLGLEDIEDDSCDLTHIQDTINKGVALLITRYRWGFGCYNFFDKTIVYPHEEKEVI